MKQTRMIRRKAGWRPTLGLMLGVSLVVLDVAMAHRETFTPEEKEQLKVATRIHLEALALTDRGAADATLIASTATARLQSLGYIVVRDSRETPDVTVKIKCEERKTWEGTVTSGGDADHLDAAARLWKGPACQLTYRTALHSSDWRHEVRGQAATETPAETDNAPTGAKALADLNARLVDDPFPYLLAAAWGQPSRLLRALDNPATTPAQRATIITLLGHTFAVEAIPALSRTLKENDPVLVQSAAMALGAIGHEDCIPLLLEQLKQENAETRLAAIKGLGRLAPLHPNSQIVPSLLAQLPKEPISTQTEIVRALGKTADRRILEPLRALNRSVQEKTRSDSSQEWKELKRALGQSLDQFDGVHTEE